MKLLFGIFQHYILKKTPNHPHKVGKKGQAYGLQGRRLLQRQWKGGRQHSVWVTNTKDQLLRLQAPFLFADGDQTCMIQKSLDLPMQLFPPFTCM